MKRWTTIIVFAASLAITACGGKNNDDNISTGNNNTNNQTNNETNNEINNETNNETNNVTNNETNNVTNNETNNETNNTTNNMTNGPDPTCENYCANVMANCTGELAQYGSEAECMDYCENVGGWEPGDSGDTAGNTIACRIYHGGDPAIADPDLHCPHAGPTGANTCGDWCEVYCTQTLAHCTGDNEVFADDAECQAACADFADTGNYNDIQYDTVQCRIYHSGAPAAGEPAVHCPHVQVDATDFCVDFPETFRFRTDPPGDYTRVDRMGMPAVSTALITDKEAYNDGNPPGDAGFVGEIVNNLTTIHSALDDDLATAGLTFCSMMDLNADGTPDCLGQPIVAGGPTPAELVVPDTVTIDPTGTAGFPNGRRLADPVIDVTLAIVLLDMNVHDPTTLAGLPLNPPENDLGVEGAFLTSFPYLHPPHTP